MKSEDKIMQEKLNNCCCIPYPIPSNPIPFSPMGIGCGINYHEEYDRDCKYYVEEHDMGATIPICTKYDKFGDFNCNECYKYKYER